jgi:hypothetical protein
MRNHQELPAFCCLRDFTLAVHEATRRLPATEAGGLALRLRATLLSAAGAVVRGSGLPDRRFAGELAHAACRLREAAYYLDVAQRLGYVDLGTAAELLSQQSKALLEVELLGRSLVQAEYAGHLVLGSGRAVAEGT